MGFFEKKDETQKEKLKEEIELEKLKFELETIKQKRINLEKINEVKSELEQEKILYNKLKPKSGIEKLADNIAGIQGVNNKK